ncbi:hypothetical protein B6U90_03495 [Thermoplasmatales archaeon ex4484_6]|nr:MAG: hypothetical protein B6U90_03495 [Thermoplasmatales archaeon ex4484_6]RLF67389.1 MAG: hypothetical protein DRN57_05800 [Thermoplasmata archaeon]
MARGKKKPSNGNITEDPMDEYLSLFVHDDSDRVMGESIGVEGKDIIIKKGGEFFRVPLSSLELEERILRVVKRIDWKKAKKKGDKWKSIELDPL